MMLETQIDLVGVVRTLLNSLDLSGEVLTVSADGTNTTITVGNSYHLRKSLLLSIEGNDYTVVSVNAQSNTIVIEGVPTINVGDAYKVPNPFFFHGTNYLVSTDFDLKHDEDRLPMFYMEKNIRERWGGRGSNLAATPDFRFVFADHADYADWLPDDFNSERIIGLKRLAWAFRQHILEYTGFATSSIDGFDIEAFDKFGIYRRNKGAVENLFNHTLSAVGMLVTIPIYKYCLC